MILGILMNESGDAHLNWEIACKKKEIDYCFIDLTSNNWLDQISETYCDGFLACPPGREMLFKQLYDERIYIISKVLKYFVYFSYEEISIYENKKFLSYWLKANNLPHPITNVFYSKKEAFEFSKQTKFPVVSKFSIGASGKGVKIHPDKASLEKYIEKAFTDGLRQDWGPNLKMGSFKTRLLKILKNPQRITNRLLIYKKLFGEIQKNFVILQEYIPHDYEWRIVKIGESYFGHQKVKQGDKASGTKGINYIIPPPILLTFVKDLCDEFGFNTMAVDLFEDGQGGYLINELQCVFGHVQAYICENEGVPGRFVNSDGLWKFEKGFFNENLSYDLRIENALSLIKREI